ncbi:uncharacterized protein LOC105185255 [Harpegnathos saltator]|uniref:uncharacterized protein LOC105185255 n=1 Tax=Harpegnathos saltator TaxID=610380 RepID=UPI00058BF56A|nr:uncharacterized protein LOC105185255 [Harpegnathos saltator]
MSDDLKSVRKIKRENVKKAIDLIIKTNAEKRNNRVTNQISSNNKVAFYCNKYKNIKKRKRISVVGFSKSLALSEMQLYIARQDWKHAIHLLPTLLEYSNEIEPLVWKYMFIIVLHMNDSSHLREFFEQCAGIHGSSISIFLERLLSLPLQENN